MAALFALGICTGAQAKPRHAEKPVAAALKHHPAKPQEAPRQRPLEPQAAPLLDTPLDLSHAVPLDQSSKLPSTSDRYQNLQSQIRKNKPAVESAKAIQYFRLLTATMNDPIVSATNALVLRGVATQGLTGGVGVVTTSVQ